VSEHHNAGQGPVLLDIGGNVGAIVLDMPSGLLGSEIEIRPVGAHDESAPLRHVGVVDRSAGGPPRPTAVFAEVEAGEYELYVRPFGDVEVRASVRGGEVTRRSWPSAQVVTHSQ
jgi:hypothetical protein